MNANQNNNLASHIKRVTRELRAYGMRKSLTLLAIRNSERDVRVNLTPIGQDGTSYTNGKDITITLWPSLLPKTFKVIKTALETFTAHEAEHIRSSNFPDMKKTAELVGEYYEKKYGYNKAVGEKLGASLYNSVEDGRIERIAVNRFPGEERGFRYINAIIWKMNAIDVEKPSMYADFMRAILCLSKTGLKPENWDTMYLGQEADIMLNEIAYIIYDATCSDFTEDVKDAVLKINEIIDPFIYEALEKDSDLQNALDQMAQDGSDACNDADTQAAQAGSNGNGTSMNKPQNCGNGSGSGNGQGSGSNGGGNGAGGNSQGQGSGVGNTSGAKNAQDALDSAEEHTMTADDLEKEINDDETLQEEIDKQVKENEKANEANSDEEVTQKDLDGLEKQNNGLDFGNAQLEHFQQALSEETAYDVTDEISTDGNKIYNQLKRLFQERSDVTIRRQKRGRLDSSRLHSMVAMKNAGQIEDKLFYKVKKAVKASCAAYVVVDTSGSTGGQIFNDSMDACAKIELGFGKLIPLKIAAYDSDWNFRFRVIRDFNNKQTATNLSYNFKKLQSAGGGTPTAEAMALAGYELEKRNEANKLLIVITDGSPDNQEKVKEQVHKLRKKGIKVVAILISDIYDKRLVNAFNDMYEGRDIVTERSQDVAAYLIKLLTRWITSSMYK